MRLKFLMAMVAALVLALAMSTTAAALTMTPTPGEAIEAVSQGEVSFTGGLFTIRCPVTLNGTLARSATMASGNQFGAVTEVRIGRCSGGVAERVLLLPWRLKFETFLPTAFTRENLRGFLFLIERVGFELALFGEAIRCLYEGNAAGLVVLTPLEGVGRYTVGAVQALSEKRLPLSSGGELCPSFGTFAATFNVRPTQTVTIS